jgi:hypothetical protein
MGATGKGTGMLRATGESKKSTPGISKKGLISL